MATKAVKKISVIPATPKHGQHKGVVTRCIRVAAYCRVSTLQEEQESSYEAQVRYYTDKIEQTPGWENAGIFADDGKSGTNTKKRDDFRAMIEKAMSGKIDMILTKSVSRFARNTVDALTLIRQLKEKNVAVVFEKEGINTLEATGELLITILSSLAQEESRNISENIRWGLARKFEKGIPSINHTMFMGYTKNEAGELVIVPEEAEIVRLIFRLYLEGYSSIYIARYLEEHQIKTVRGNDKWHSTVIDKMLRNEKYMGDVLIQKTYTADYITKKKVRNDGVLPQYYIEDNHEAIIPKELFYQVQEEILRRGNIKKNGEMRKKKQKGKYSSKFALTGLVICGECGHGYRRTTWSRNGKKKIVWRCINRLENGTKNCKDSPTVEETVLQNAVMAAIRKVVTDESDYFDVFRQNVIQVIGKKKPSEEMDRNQSLIQEKKNEMADLILNCTDGFNTEQFEQKYQAITKEIQRLQQEAFQMSVAGQHDLERINQVKEFLQNAEKDSLEYDDYLIRMMVARVQILSGEKIMVQFKSGLYMEMRMEG